MVNRYYTITIGTQTWFRENLRTSRYRNGDRIAEVTFNGEWSTLTAGAWCWYENDSEKEIPYGKLYNWVAVDDTSGLCPTGWHVPSLDEWATLIQFLGGESVAGGKMKKTGTIAEGTGYWIEPNTGATNQSAFTGLPGGSFWRLP